MGYNKAENLQIRVIKEFQKVNKEKCELNLNKFSILESLQLLSSLIHTYYINLLKSDQITKKKKTFKRDSW